jgi:hypothetical protein
MLEFIGDAMLEFIGTSPQLVIDGLQAAGCLCIFQHHISGLISVVNVDIAS